MKLSDSVEVIKGVGAAVASKLDKLSVYTVADLINYYPRRYDDYSKVVQIVKAKPGVITLEAKIDHAKGRYARRGLHITEAIASDESGSLRLTWFNQPYRAESIKAGETYYVSGEFGLHRQKLSMVNPSVELASSFPVNTARIVPVYKETKGIKSGQIRNFIREVSDLIDQEPETLPEYALEEFDLMPRSEALKSIHFPESSDNLELARYRLGFEEVFALCLASLMTRSEQQKLEALPIPFKQELAKSFVDHLPFKLTDEQRQTIWQIYLDMGKDHPMNRLVEGDVGTGKTVVATMAALMVIDQGYQVAFMAPTELLARQHGETIYKLLEPLNMTSELTILTGSMSAAKKKMVYKNLEAGKIRLIVGTHALIQDDVNLHKLGLVVIDEQHRFGVNQRQTLQNKVGHMPHVLSMTATPIPRSLQLTLYGELDITTIKHKPYTNKAIITKIVSPAQRARMYKSVLDKVKKDGTQVFVVCPLITDSTQISSKSAEKVYEELSHGAFADLKVGLLHGKMKAPEKEEVMKKFVAKKLDVLVATTIIEVGVDVPNANIMVIESAERFGLAQVHQLRGRVGRSNVQGYCYLVDDSKSQDNIRLRSLEATHDGFKLAELDLKLRGPGAIYGTIQHGPLDLRIAKLSDHQLIADARKAAQQFIDKNEDLLKYSQLNDHVNSLRAITNLN